MYDIIILGSGMAGAILGSILAKHDASVLIIDSSKHPRFAIGEATLRESTMMFKLLSLRFDIPELAHPSTYLNVINNIGRGSGMKRSIGYVYHRKNQKQKADEIFQTEIPETFDGPEIHYFREEIDEYLAKVAIKYGAKLIENTKVNDVDVNENRVKITTDQGDSYVGKFLYDASGYNSLMANLHNLREQPCRFKTNSRSIFTHMKGVKRYEDCGPVENHQVNQRWSQGTLHHCFDGGWLWVIPMNNGENPKHDIVSVGLQLDNRKHDYRNTPPQEEFREVISRYPSIAEQFENAKAIRPWVSTGERLQWSSNKTIGQRFCLAAHAAGSTGPLMSRGLILTARTLYPLAEILLNAIKNDDFSEEQFQIIEDIQQSSLDTTDMLCEGFYASWQDWELFNAWIKVWYTVGVLGFFHMESAFSLYKRTGDEKATWDLLFGRNHTSIVSAISDFQPYLNRAGKIMRDYIDRKIVSVEAAKRIYDLLDSLDFLPPGFHFTDAGSKVGGAFSREHWEQIIRWGNYEAPDEIKQNLYRGNSDENIKLFMKMVDDGLSAARLAPLRDFIARTELTRNQVTKNQ